MHYNWRYKKTRTRAQKLLNNKISWLRTWVINWNWPKICNVFVSEQKNTRHTGTWRTEDFRNKGFLICITVVVKAPQSAWRSCVLGFNWGTFDISARIPSRSAILGVYEYLLVRRRRRIIRMLFLVEFLNDAHEMQKLTTIDRAHAVMIKGRSGYAMMS
jgi:hypothetical protein